MDTRKMDTFGNCYHLPVAAEILSRNIFGIWLYMSDQCQANANEITDIQVYGANKPNVPLPTAHFLLCAQRLMTLHVR